jgi:hypothetical protein
MAKKIFWVIAFLVIISITLIAVLNVKVAKFYFIDYKGNPNISYIRFLVLSSNKTEALEKVIDEYLNYAKNNYVNSELLPYMKLKNVKVVKNQCLINMDMLKSNNIEYSSFAETRSLVMLFKTIKDFDKDIKNFRIIGIEKYFRHIDTRFPLSLDGNNLIMLLADQK